MGEVKNTRKSLKSNIDNRCFFRKCIHNSWQWLCFVFHLPPGISKLLLVRMSNTIVDIIIKFLIINLKNNSMNFYLLSIIIIFLFLLSFTNNWSVDKGITWITLFIFQTSMNRGDLNKPNKREHIITFDIKVHCFVSLIWKCLP